MREFNVYAIVVTYNGQKYIENCLRSLRESTVHTNIIVIDNASTDNTVQLIRDGFSEVKLFESSENLGFGRANNIGIKYAYDNGANHVLLLNQDAYVDCDCLEKLIQLQENNQEYGILSPLHLSGNGDKLDSCFSLFIGRSHDKNSLFSDYFLNKKKKDIYRVDFINAAIWLLSRNCICNVGLFNPSFVHYGEDEDFALRVNHLGFSVGIVPAVLAVHDRLQGKDDISEAKHLMMVRSDIIGRLSRVDFSKTKNISSVLLRSLSYSPLNNSNFVAKFSFKILNVYFVVKKIFLILKNRKISTSGALCFFDDADKDMQNYMKSSSP